VKLLHGIKQHWAGDALPAAMIVGWFSWWIWCCFVIDFSGGVWNAWPGSGVLYFAGDDDIPLGSIPVMLFWISMIAIAPALCGLIGKSTTTWQGRIMNVLAYLVLVGSIGYLVAVDRREMKIVEQTRLFISNLEGREASLGEYDREHLNDARWVYDRYTERTKTPR
jgi:hypothetical protein